MGIKLGDHINYDINNWITEEEAEKLFKAAGFVELNKIDGYKLINVNSNEYNESDMILKSEDPIKQSLRIEIKNSIVNTNPSSTELIFIDAIEEFIHQYEFKSLGFKGAV